MRGRMTARPRVGPPAHRAIVAQPHQRRAAWFVIAPPAVVAERFLREAQTVARLEHPHIVPIYKVGRQEEIFYLIMRCIDGPSLRQLLETQKALSVGDAARITRQVADALAYAHS